MNQINIPKGTKDVLPSESYKWQYVKAKIREICNLYNVKEIRTPVFEHTELFTRSIGGDTDVVSKEMYTFLDKGERSITLKPEGTASVARSYTENSLDALSLPLKMFYITPVFRYERPQAGRLREHYQFGVEIYGDPTPHMDFEAINIAYSLFTKLGVKNLVLNINSIGCPDCRAVYLKELKKYLGKHLGEMCPTCAWRFEHNPLRILDCKEEKCRSVIEKAPAVTSFLCENCQNHFDSLLNLLKEFNIPHVVNPLLVRGLDYYTKTVFEFVSTDLGAQGTVCGGGRYDNMVESMGGKATPCVGFGLGLERLIMLLDKLNIKIPQKQLDYFILVQSPQCLPFCLSLLNGLRAKGYSADTDFLGRSLKSQFKYADKQNTVFAVVVGENEVKSGRIQIKRLADGTVEEKNISDLLK